MRIIRATATIDWVVNQGSTMSTSSIHVYIGAFTGNGRPDRGIYHCTLDLTSGRLSEPTLAATAQDPSFLELHPNGRFLYAAERGDRTGEDVVSAFSITPGSGQLQRLNQQPTGGHGACHVSVDSVGKNVLVANYSSGSASAIPILNDGRLGKPTGFVQHEGSGPHASRQEGPHAHSINVSPDDRFAYVADLGIYKIMIYRFDTSAGTLRPNDPAFASLAAGAGPRHLAFHPNARYAYVINELDGTITGFSYNSTTGALTPIETVSTLPDGFQGRNQCAEVRVHPAGTFLYGSNRGHDSIAMYRIDAGTGRLNLIGIHESDVAEPRNFNLDPSGTFCLVANQNDDSIVVFRIDPAAGTLEPTEHRIAVEKPVCIRFSDSIPE